MILERLATLAALPSSASLGLLIRPAWILFISILLLSWFTFLPTHMCMRAYTPTHTLRLSLTFVEEGRVKNGRIIK